MSLSSQASSSSRPHSEHIFGYETSKSTQSRTSRASLDTGTCRWDDPTELREDTFRQASVGMDGERAWPLLEAAPGRPKTQLRRRRWAAAQCATTYTPSCARRSKCAAKVVRGSARRARRRQRWERPVGSRRPSTGEAQVTTNLHERGETTTTTAGPRIGLGARTRRPGSRAGGRGARGTGGGGGPRRTCRAPDSSTTVETPIVTRSSMATKRERRFGGREEGPGRRPVGREEGPLDRRRSQWGKKGK